MELSVLMTIAVPWIVAVITPGPDFLTTMHVSASSSRRAGVAVALGVGLGTIIWSLTAIVGVTALFTSFGWLYRTMQLGGALFLILMGTKMVRGALKAPAVAPRTDHDIRLEGMSVQRAFMRGLITDLSNPKAALFFSSLFAVAIPPGSSAPALAGYVVVIVGTSVLWNGSAALLLSTGPIARRYRRAERALTVVAGAFLAIFGVRLAATK